MPQGATQIVAFLIVRILESNPCFSSSTEEQIFVFGGDAALHGFASAEFYLSHSRRDRDRVACGVRFLVELVSESSAYEKL
jgi:hypothetical protein